MTTYSQVCCRYLMALFCALALLSSIQAEELSSADAIVEARNEEGGMELGQPQLDKEPLAMKVDIPKKPIDSADMDEKIAEKTKEPVDGEAAPEQSVAIHKTEDSKKENGELVMNAEVLKQPGMARLARYINSFHNYQTRHAQVRAANVFDNDDDYDDDVVAEERAIRRRKRIRRRNANNRLRRTHRRKNVANRRRNSNRHVAVRRPSVKKTTKRRSSNNNRRRSGSNKSSKPKRSKKSKRRSNKKNSRKTKRTKKNRKSSRRQFASEQDQNSARKQVEPASQMIVIVDGGAGEVAAAAAQAA